MADINKKSKKELDSKYESLPEAACSFCHYSEEPDEEGFSEVFGDYMVDNDLVPFPNSAASIHAQLNIIGDSKECGLYLDIDVSEPVDDTGTARYSSAPIFAKSIPITYCPCCGRKLTNAKFRR